MGSNIDDLTLQSQIVSYIDAMDVMHTTIKIYV